MAQPEWPVASHGATGSIGGGQDGMTGPNATRHPQPATSELGPESRIWLSRHVTPYRTVKSG